MDTNQVLPPTNPNATLGIKAGPMLIGKRNKDKNGKTGQGSQAPPTATQVIMAGDNKTGEIIETLGSSASSGDWIHDFVHSNNPEFKGKTKKERIKMALGAYYSHHNEEMTPHLWNKFKEHSVNRIKQIHKEGKISLRDAHLQLRHQGLSHEEATRKLGEETEAADDTRPNKGAFIHAGFGIQGGAGIHGHVNRVVGNTVHFTGAHTEVGLDGKPFKKTYKAPLGTVTVLNREDYVVDIEDLATIFEAQKKRLPTEVIKTQIARDPIQVKEARKVTPSFSAGQTVHFSGRSAHGEVEGHMPVKIINPHSNAHLITHTKSGRDYEGASSHIPTATVERAERKGAFPSPAKRFEAHHHTLQHIKEEALFEARKPHMPLEGHLYHHKTDAELHYIMKDAGEASRLHDQMHKGTGKYNKYADQVNDAATVMHYRRNGGQRVVKEDVIYEAGKTAKEAMKRKYLGKTRGTTATGKTAHQVVIDPFIKVDKEANRRQPMPTPDRGI